MSKKKRIRGRAARARNRYRDELELANGCLDMVREELIDWGLPMEGCAPMFYPEAINNVVATVAVFAGIKDRSTVQKLVREKFAPASRETAVSGASLSSVGARE